MRLALLFLLTIKASLSWAGVGAHGGNVVSCAGQPSVTLDYYNATLPTMAGPAKTVDITSMSEDQAFEFIRSRLKGTAFRNLFDANAWEIGSIENWIAADLKSIDDSAEPYSLPPSCVRETAAARQGNSMYGDPKVIAKLSPAQRGLLRAHEAFYRLSQLETSAPIRDLFRIMLAQDFDGGKMDQAVRVLGYHFLMWNNLGNNDMYVAKDSEVKIPGTIRLDPVDDGPLGPIFGYTPTGSIGATIYIHTDCTIETQTCKTKSLEVHGKGPDFKGCGIALDDKYRLTFTCPSFGGKTLTLTSIKP